MLKVQEYLSSYGDNALECLNSEFGIKACHHPVLPLVILNYDMIESKPKSHPVIMECRGLVLEKKSWNLVARAFPRFFNWSEEPEIMAKFDFSDFTVQEKVDGSLILLFKYNGEWMVTTRGSFAEGEIDPRNYPGITWKSAVMEALGISRLDDIPVWEPFLIEQGIRKGYTRSTYVCELCTTYNKVVQEHKEPKLYLLTSYLDEYEVEPARHMSFGWPMDFSFKSADEIITWLKEKETTDPTFEGVVIRDKNGLRFKIKNPGYLILHRMRGQNNECLTSPENLMPFVLKDEADEFLTYFPEADEAFNFYTEQLLELESSAWFLWQQNRHLQVQKDFAMAVKHHRLSAILFNARKLKVSKLEDQLHDMNNFRTFFRGHEEAILKHISPWRPAQCSSQPSQ
jgi:hypothetical protein